MRNPTEEHLKELHHTLYFNIIKRRNYPTWKGRPILKNPTDLMLYHEVLYEKRPDIIIETGTKFGGSALFLADMCETMKYGHVITIDVNPCEQTHHDRLTYLISNSIDRELIRKLKEVCKGKKVMVILDSKHTEYHCKWELFLYSRIVTTGQYIVLEDIYNGQMEPHGVTRARDWFLRRTTRFELVDLTKKYLTGMTRDGWILRKQ